MQKQCALPQRSLTIKATNMRIERIEFSVEKTTPLEPITGNEQDRFANVKPRVSMTIAVDQDDDLQMVFEEARNHCLDQLVDFQREIVALLKG
jgi:hypothetical protein